MSNNYNVNDNRKEYLKKHMKKEGELYHIIDYPIQVTTNKIHEIELE